MHSPTRVRAHSCINARTFVIALAGALSILAFVAPAARAVAAERIDQKQTTYAGGLSVRQGATQTITAGVRGQLVRIDLPFCTFQKGSVVKLAVRGTAPNSQTATTTLTFAQSYSDCDWFTLTFARPLAQRVGEVLRLTVTTAHGAAPLWGSNAVGGDPYTRGKGTWSGHIVNDFAFRTYVR